jgi:hypothetical protein
VAQREKQEENTTLIKIVEKQNTSINLIENEKQSVL